MNADRAKELLTKILAVDQLPTQEECKALEKYYTDLDEQKCGVDSWCKLLKSYGVDTWSELLRSHGIFLVVHDRLVGELIKLIKEELHVDEALELGSGNGKLAYWLRRNGMKIHATDDSSWDIPAENVEHIGYEKALHRYKPRLVLAAFLSCKEKEKEMQYYQDIMAYPTVKYLIWIHFFVGIPDKYPPGVSCREFSPNITYPCQGDSAGVVRCRMVLFTKT